MKTIQEQLTKGVQTSSAEETMTVAGKLADVLPENCVLALHGNLGVGKSTFVSGLARAWGIRQPTASPTFNLFHLYRGARVLVHFDAYRLTDAREMDALMIEDFLETPYCLAVEWPERIASWLPDETLHLELGIISEGIHKIRYRG